MSMGQKKVEPIFVWSPWWNEGPAWIGQSMGKYWRNTLKTADSSQWITCPPHFGFLKTCSTRKGLGLQGQDLSCKEKTCPTRIRLGLQGKDLSYKDKTWVTRKRLGLQGKEARPHYYKSPNTSSHQGTHNWPLSNTLELWEYFWLSFRRVFGRLHTGAFCKVFLFSSRVHVTLERTDRASHWWKLRHHQGSTVNMRVSSAKKLIETSSLSKINT